MKTSFVKGRITIRFCKILFLVRSTDCSGNGIFAGCYPFNFSMTAVIQFQDNHQKRHLVAFVSVTIEDDHWVKIRHPFQGD
jgi:hypothetical protein